MALKDIGSFLSRYFVIGFYVPSFIGLIVLVFVLRKDWVPDQLQLTDSRNHLIDSGLGSHLLRTAILALPVAFLLSGMWSRVFALYKAGFFGLDVNVPRLQGAILWRKRRAWDKLWTDALSPDPFVRGASSLKLFERYPRRREHVQPTFVSNVVRAYEEYAGDRWGMDYAMVWPRIEALFSEREQALHDEIRTSVSFAINLSLAFLVVGLLRAIGVLWPIGGVDWHWGLFLSLIPFFVSYIVYRLLAIDAVVASGHRIRASLDLHRLELYDKVGVQSTRAFSAQEREVGVALSRYLVSGPTDSSEELGRKDWARTKAGN